MASHMDKRPMGLFQASTFGSDRSTVTLTLGQNMFFSNTYLYKIQIALSQKTKSFKDTGFCFDM